MKFSSVALLVLTAVEKAHPVYSFLSSSTGTCRTVGSQSLGKRSLAIDMTTEADIDMSWDVSIPYDSAAELAYTGWLAKYSKPYDEERYAVFLSNYKAITIMNVSAKKKSRDGVTENPSLLSLNEFADCTAEEYEAATKEGGESSDDSVDTEEEAPITTGNILGDAFKAVESQSAASTALEEAADALTKEEEKLATQLGLDGVEELENAIDALQGIGPEGTELENENLAREARVRSAYLDWCKEYGKISDETRFPQFYSKFRPPSPST